MSFEMLLGKKILSVKFDFETQEFIEFEVLDEGNVKYLLFVTEGDCCDECYFTDISGVECLVGSTVTSVRQNYLGVSNRDDKFIGDNSDCDWSKRERVSEWTHGQKKDGWSKEEWSGVKRITPRDLQGDGCIKEYGTTLTTDKGYVDFVYHDNSNGYYGGYISHIPDKDRERVDKYNSFTSKLRPLTEDFSA